MGEAASNSERSALSQPFVLGSPSQNSAASSTAASTTVIGAGAIFDGELRTESDLIVSGTVNGTIISSGLVTVTSTGRIAGNMKGAEIIFAGTIEGNLEATAELTIVSTAQILGDIETIKLIVEPGAKIRGRCTMLSASAHAVLDGAS